MNHKHRTSIACTSAVTVLDIHFGCSPPVDNVLAVGHENNHDHTLNSTSTLSCTKKWILFCWLNLLSNLICFWFSSFYYFFKFLFFQIRRKFGCYDIIIEVEGREVRHCNWVRFVKSSTNIAEVNIVGLSVQGDTIFQALKPIHPNDELVVFFDVPSRKTQDDLRVTQTVSGKRDNSNVASESDLESPKSGKLFCL